MLALCLVATVAEAESVIQGIWQVTVPSDPAYSAMLLVDADGRAILTGLGAHIGKTPMKGYVADRGERGVDVVLTNAGKTKVDRMRCVVQSPDVLNCDTLFDGGLIGDMYYMRRIGAGPVNLLK